MIHRETLDSKTVPKNLHDAMAVVINIVNYVKGSALNTRLFREPCRDMDANHTDLLFHTQVRWLSKGNMREEIKLVLSYSNKVDLLSAFNREVFVAQMAYLADIFETLNELNKKLQGQRSNVIVHTDSINAFMAKLQLWGKQMKKGNTAFFQRLSDILVEKDIKDPLKEEIFTHLDHLGTSSSDISLVSTLKTT
ncbi:protein FAM200B-like [Palaemon carinicauda]|uniref:protein FAM200B-like n=1 Tax=Palaemon carinicauda TaxID=392227 RepID=UPI0035B6193A